MMKDQSGTAPLPQGRARGLYDEQLQRLQQEKKLLKAEAAARKLKEVA
jgi:hypothetical protein